MNFIGDPMLPPKPNRRSNISGEKLLFVCLTVALSTWTYSVAGEAQVTFRSNGQQLNNFVGRGVALADFTGDGALDAFVVNESGQNSQYRIYFGDGHGQFVDSGQRPERSMEGGKPVVYDIDGDGSKDVITGRTVWLNDGHGHFSPNAARFADTDAARFWQCRLADLNGDGLIDVFAIVMTDKGAKGRIYLNDKEGPFQYTGQPLGQGILAAVELGDVNGDGSVDAVLSGWRNAEFEIYRHKWGDSAFLYSGTEGSEARAVQKGNSQNFGTADAEPQRGGKSGSGGDFLGKIRSMPTCNETIEMPE